MLIGVVILLMKNIKACLTSTSDNWKTPKRLYDYFIYRNFVDCFPYCSEFDQYEKQYKNENLFINPPYSHINKKDFRNWLYNQILNNCFICLLIPSRTDTNFFHDLIVNNYVSYIIFFHGRLKFNDSNSAPFPSMLVVLRNPYITPNFIHLYSVSLNDFLNFELLDVSIRKRA